jgi:hypothetical protein
MHDTVLGKNIDRFSKVFILCIFSNQPIKREKKKIEGAKNKEVKTSNPRSYHQKLYNGSIKREKKAIYRKNRNKRKRKNRLNFPFDMNDFAFRSQIEIQSC